MADLIKNIIYRDFRLNDEDISTNATQGNSVGSGISGSVLDSIDYNDVDVVQFMEKRSLEDGMDVGDVYKGARRIRVAGTLYGTTRADLYDRLDDLRAALDPVLAQADEPADKGYQPFYFSTPTLRLVEFETGYIDKRLLAMPRALGYMLQRDTQGGDGMDSLAIPFQATLVCADPRIMGAEEQDYDLPEMIEVTGATAAAGTDLITKTAHGLVAGDRVSFTTLTAGTGLNLTTAYYVLASGLTANAFKVSLTSGGAIVDITVNYTVVSYVKSTGLTNVGSLVNRGNHYGVLNMLLVVGPQAGTISVQAGTSVFTITLPASTGERIIRLKGDDKIVTIEENSTEVTDQDVIAFTGDNTWPQVQPGTHSYSVTVARVWLKDSSHMWFWESYA